MLHGQSTGWVDQDVLVVDETAAVISGFYQVSGASTASLKKENVWFATQHK